MKFWYGTPEQRCASRRLLVWFFWMSFAPMTLASDWVQWRGNDSDGRVPSHADWQHASSFTLDLVFQKSLGSGFSSVSIKDQFAITLATLGDGDFVIAFDANTGTMRWRYRLEDFFPGQEGSKDGPLSSPTIDETRVYALSARGRLVALSLTDGTLIWDHDLGQLVGGEPGAFGRTTAPLIHGSQVLVAAGGTENRTLVAFEKSNGSLQWAAGIEDQVFYQSPVIVEIAGKTQCIVPTNQNLFSVDPLNGKVLWKKTLKQAHADSHILKVNETHFILASTRNLQMFEVKAEAGTYEVTQKWQSLAMKRTFGPPVLIDDHLYGFNGSFLTCVDPQSGKSLWKNRKPGGKNLIAVGNTLLFWDLEGHLIAARAQPQGFEEQGRIKLTSPKRTLSAPSFAHGKVYLRDLENFYVVGMRPSAKEAKDNNDNESLVGIMKKLHEALAKGPADGVINQFKADYPQWPIQDQNGWYHFLYEGKVQDIAIVGDMTGGLLPQPLNIIPGTDLFFRSYQMEKGNRWEYQFAHFDERFVDPKNPHKIAINGQEKSVVTHKDWQSFAVKKTIAKKYQGKLVSIKVKAPDSDLEVETQVYLPASYRKKDKDLPLVVVARGKEALEWGHFAQVLDDRDQQGKPAMIVAFLILPNIYWRGPNSNKTSQLLKEKILPELSRRFPISKKRNDRAMLAQDWSALNIFRYLLLTDSSFGKFGLQSPCFGTNFDRNYLEPNLGRLPKTRFVFQWGRYDQYTHHIPLHIAEDSQRRVALLKQSGHDAIGKQHPGGHGWVVWQSQLNAMLNSLFPE